MKQLPLVCLTAMFLVITACSNNVYSMSYSPIIDAYSRQLEEVRLGMSRNDFKKVMPNAKIRGQTYVGRNIVEAFELKHNYWTGVGGYLESDYMWFYFFDDRLVKWGRPNDWPTEADLIVEYRER